MRDANTAVWDGEYTYFYNDDVEVFISVYQRLHKQLSIMFKFGNFSIKIIKPKVLPTAYFGLPKPKHYEAILPLHNS